MNFLETILDRKRKEVERLKMEVPLDDLRRQPSYLCEPRSLRAALLGAPMAIIAEIKKASPSKQVIRNDFQPVALARSCAEGGARALSVLTDREFFQGDLDYLREIRRAVDIPLLRKDFIIDEYQVHEAKAAGADAILLILAALDASTFSVLSMLAAELGLEALVEVHSVEDLEKASGASLPLVGINNRDLVTFQTDLSATFRVRSALLPGTMIVSESGIRTSGELRELMKIGIRAALIGETLMTAADPGSKIRELLDPLGGTR